VLRLYHRRTALLAAHCARLWRGVGRLDENASSNGNQGAVKLICESIRTSLRRNFAQRKSGIVLERVADAGSFLLNRMITAAEYRAWAEESLEWALHASNESSRQAFIRWAEIWLESALRVERLAALQERVSKEPITTAEYVWQLPPFQDWPRKGTRLK
jgi:hypothetical protein